MRVLIVNNGTFALIVTSTKILPLMIIKWHNADAFERFYDND